MKPTAKLRFVERVEAISTHTDGSTIGRRVRILQQWWESSMSMNLGWTGDIPIINAQGEWRDVPLEKENEST